MSTDDLQITSKEKTIFYILSCINLLEGMFTLFTILAIPADLKNAFLWGYSLKRLALIGITIVLLFIQVLLVLNSRKVLRILERFYNSSRITRWLWAIGFFTAICIWVTIWLPANRLGTLAASFIRIKPLLLWVELLIFQFFIYTKLILNEINLKDIHLTRKSNTRVSRLVILLIFLGAGLFGILRILTQEVTENQLIFPPGAPISSSQLMLGWMLFIGVYFLGQKTNIEQLHKQGWIISVFILIWITTFFVWNSAPFPCVDDRPGPYLPNNQCYPTINDAVYSIGSHYITLGEGINNHWATDKPLYMVFLAMGQWISGPRIDRYLTFQIAILSLIPSLLFILGKKFSGYGGGLLLSLISIFLGSNEIHLYQLVGGVNGKLENPELLTALFLIILCFSIFKWLSPSNTPIWAVVSGGVLGLSSLIRLNPLFILPVLLLIIIFSGWKRRKSLLIEIALFIVTFTVVFSPMILSARDAQGDNYYLLKIKGVITERYSGITDNNSISETQSSEIEPSREPQKTITPNGQNELTYPPLDSFNSDQSTIFTHFLNNEYASLAILPMNFKFHSIIDQVNQPVWDFSNNQPIWKADLSFENIFVLVFNFSIIILGIIISTKKFGLAGLSALIIQIGYHLGNAAAKTSGGRYLQPVNWVTMFYFSIGLVTFTLFLIKFFQPIKIEISIPGLKKAIASNKQDVLTKNPTFRIIGLIVLFLFSGLVIPLMNNLSTVLANEMNSNAIHLAKQQLEINGFISAEQWERFLEDPNHLIVQGKAYNARYYRNNFYRSGDISFELMLLGTEHVFVSYLFGVEPDKTFTDGSDVILAGCKIGHDNMWAADRIILNSYAVIQLDYEKSVYVDPSSNWTCK